MFRKISSGIFLFLIISLLISGADKSKKAYELIYQDIQLLKQKIIRLDENIKTNSDDIKVIKKQLEEILSMLKLFQQEQASFQESQKNIPTQYRVLLEKIETINSQLAKFSEELLEVKRASHIQLEQKEEQSEENKKKNNQKNLPSKKKAKKNCLKKRKNHLLLQSCHRPFPLRKSTIQLIQTI